MLHVERIESWRGQDVLDSEGEKAGRLEEVYSTPTGRNRCCSRSSTGGWGITSACYR